MTICYNSPTQTKIEMGRIVRFNGLEEKGVRSHKKLGWDPCSQ